MRSGLRIYTSYVSPQTLQTVVDRNLLPIFIVRSIHNSQLIGKYSDTALHFKILAPSDLLFRARRDGKIDNIEFEKRYIIEMSNVSFQEIIRKLDFLASVSGADGVVLMGYGSNYNICHRRILSGLLNRCGILENDIQELIM